MTRTGPDLSAAERAVEALMDDECVITRDQGGPGDGVLDRETGRVVAQSVLVYSGRCALSSANSFDLMPEEQGGQKALFTPTTLKLPLSALREHPEWEPEPGDLVQLTGSRRDPHLVGSTYKVARTMESTMTASRKVLMEQVGSRDPLEVSLVAGVLVLEAGAPVPAGTPPETIIYRPAAQ